MGGKSFLQATSDWPVQDTLALTAIYAVSGKSKILKNPNNKTKKNQPPSGSEIVESRWQTQNSELTPKAQRNSAR